MKTIIQLICNISLLVLPFIGNAQLDSVSVELQPENYQYLNELNDLTIGTCIKVDTRISDFDFFGEILITAYDIETNFPVDMIKFTKSQIISNEMLGENVITAKVCNSIESGRTYRIDVQVRDYQGMNLALKQEMIEVD